MKKKSSTYMTFLVFTVLIAQSLLAPKNCYAGGDGTWIFLYFGWWYTALTTGIFYCYISANKKEYPRAYKIGMGVALFTILTSTISLGLLLENLGNETIATYAAPIVYYTALLSTFLPGYCLVAPPKTAENEGHKPEEVSKLEIVISGEYWICPECENKNKTEICRCVCGYEID